MKRADIANINAKCSQGCCGRMPNFSQLVHRFLYRGHRTNTRVQEAKTVGLKKTQLTHLASIMVLLAFNTKPTGGQTDFRGRAYSKDEGSTHAPMANIDNDVIHRIRALTTQAVITVLGRGYQRHLTVFEASVHGHIEFGFPPPKHRPLGSLEISDVTPLAHNCCPRGVRKVTLKHSCSNLYLTVDNFGQARACQLTQEGREPGVLRKSTHCVNGRNLHSCRETPYLYLDSLKSVRSVNDTPVDANQYKLRFERRNIRKRGKKVMYAVVVRSTWEIKLRAQNSILRRAVSKACLQLWQKSIDSLFQRALSEHNTRQRHIRFATVCSSDPVVVKAAITGAFHRDDFTNAVEAAWRQQTVIGLLGTSMPWTHMSDTHKGVFAVIASRIVRNYLLESLLRAGNTHCVRQSQWSRLPAENRKSLLEKTLTLSWLQRQVNARDLIISSIEQYLDSRTTTFVVNEVR